MLEFLENKELSCEEKATMTVSNIKKALRYALFECMNQGTENNTSDDEKIKEKENIINGFKSVKDMKEVFEALGINYLKFLCRHKINFLDLGVKPEELEKGEIIAVGKNIGNSMKYARKAGLFERKEDSIYGYGDKYFVFPDDGEEFKLFDKIEDALSFMGVKSKTKCECCSEETKKSVPTIKYVILKKLPAVRDILCFWERLFDGFEVEREELNLKRPHKRIVRVMSPVTEEVFLSNLSHGIEKYRDYVWFLETQEREYEKGMNDYRNRDISDEDENLNEFELKVDERLSKEEVTE